MFCFINVIMITIHVTTITLLYYKIKHKTRACEITRIDYNLGSDLKQNTTSAVVFSSFPTSTISAIECSLLSIFIIFVDYVSNDTAEVWSMTACTVISSFSFTLDLKRDEVRFSQRITSKQKVIHSRPHVNIDAPMRPFRELYLMYSNTSEMLRRDESRKTIRDPEKLKWRRRSGPDCFKKNYRNRYLVTPRLRLFRR